MQVTWSSFHSDLSENQVRKYVPRAAGIYLLWVKLTESNKWKCFYVGQASNLEQRLLDHLSESEENECIKTKVSIKVCGFEYTEVSTQNERDGIEKFLYDKYNPKCNQIDPGGTPIVVNLP